MRFSRLPVGALLIFGLVTLPAKAQSQEPDSQRETTVGFGISVSGSGGITSAYNGSPLSISVPVTFSSVRVEPEIGYYRYQVSSPSQDRLDSRLFVGTGVFYLSRMDDLQLQIGGRLGLSRNSLDYNRENTTPNTSTDRTNFDYTIGPAAGGEYYISNSLSLGVEARLLYTNQNRDSSDSRSIINTEGAAYLRIHF